MAACGATHAGALNVSGRPFMKIYIRCWIGWVAACGAAHAAPLNASRCPFGKICKRWSIRDRSVGIPRKEKITNDGATGLADAANLRLALGRPAPRYIVQLWAWPKGLGLVQHALLYMDMDKVMGS